jgi:hypothetical protein
VNELGLLLPIFIGIHQRAVNVLRMGLQFPAGIRQANTEKAGNPGKLPEMIETTGIPSHKTVLTCLDAVLARGRGANCSSPVKMRGKFDFPTDSVCFHPHQDVSKSTLVAHFEAAQPGFHGAGWPFRREEPCQGSFSGC